MEEKVLYNVLKAIKNRGSGRDQAPDENYLKALETIGLITIDWDNSLTSFGTSILSTLSDKLEKW